MYPRIHVRNRAGSSNMCVSLATISFYPIPTLHGVRSTHFLSVFPRASMVTIHCLVLPWYY